MGDCEVGRSRDFGVLLGTAHHRDPAISKQAVSNAASAVCSVVAWWFFLVQFALGIYEGGSYPSMFCRGACDFHVRDSNFGKESGAEGSIGSFESGRLIANGSFKGGSNSVVESQPSKLLVAGSIPVSRSRR